LKSCENSTTNAKIKTLIAAVVGFRFMKLLIKQYTSITTKKSPKVKRIKPSDKNEAIITSAISIIKKPMK